MWPRRAFRPDAAMEEWLLSKGSILSAQQHPWSWHHIHRFRICAILVAGICVPNRLYDGLQEGPQKTESHLVSTHLQPHSDHVT